MYRLQGAIISWKCKCQSNVPFSSAEAEYVALCSEAQETVWLKHLSSSLGFEQVSPTILQEDNKGTIALPKSPQRHPGIKHIERDCCPT